MKRLPSHLQSLFRRRRRCREDDHFVRKRICVDSNPRYNGWIYGSMFQLLFRRSLAEDWLGFHLVKYVPAIEHATEDRVKVVEVRLSFVANKKLRTIGVGACINVEEEE